jgi:hypothetical protein
MKTTLLLAFSLAAGAASAQQPPSAAPTTAQVDARFANWLGCWRLEDDLAGTGARLCITPDNPGVRLQTVVGKLAGGNESVRPDGVTRPIEDKECKGTERAEWSRDGQRLFRHTDVTCGAEPARKVASIAFLAAGPSWINVQLVDGGPGKVVRVQRYRRAIDQTLADGSRVMQAVLGASRAATADEMLWNVDDVIEASAKAPAEAVQAAVAEAKGRFDLNKKSLIALADAGVAEPVIDLMIGLAFPQRFVVERRSSYGSSAPVGISMGGGYYDPFMGPLYSGNMYADCYGSGYGYGYRSYYSTCGSMYSSFYNPYYPGYNNYGGYYYPGAGNVAVDPGTGGAAERGDGRVVNGRGYTQVRPRESEPAPVRTGSRDNGNGSSAGWSGASAGGSSGVSSQGYSGGSSGSSSGSSGASDSGARTAVPRPGGGF